MAKAYVVFSKVVLVKEKGAMYEMPKYVQSPKDAYKVAIEITRLDEEAQEVFSIIILNTKNKVVSMHEISRGSLSATLVHPREVYKVALLHNAAAIVLVHNHPSGQTDPSPEDIKLTQSLVDAGRLIGIQVLDHVIVGDGYASLRERGYIA